MRSVFKAKFPADKHREIAFVIGNILIIIGIYIYGLPGKFLRIIERADVSQTQKSLVPAFRNYLFNKKRDRQSIRIDEHRFLNVNVFRHHVTETRKEFAVSSIGFYNPGNLYEFNAF